MLIYYFISPNVIFNLHCQLVLRISGNMLHKNTSQCKIPIVPKKAGLASRNVVHRQKRQSTLFRFLPLYSSFCERLHFLLNTLSKRYTYRTLSNYFLVQWWLMFSSSQMAFTLCPLQRNLRFSLPVWDHRMRDKPFSCTRSPKLM